VWKSLCISLRSAAVFKDVLISPSSFVIPTRNKSHSNSRGSIPITVHGSKGLLAFTVYGDQSYIEDDEAKQL